MKFHALEESITTQSISNSDNMTIKNIVESWYDECAAIEEHRLDECRVEFEVTLRVIKFYIQSMGLQEAKILDVGGGPGRYGITSPLSEARGRRLMSHPAVELARLGHSIILNYISS